MIILFLIFTIVYLVESYYYTIKHFAEYSPEYLGTPCMFMTIILTFLLAEIILLIVLSILHNLAKRFNL